MPASYHIFNIFESSNIIHANSTRIGGTSSGKFESLNLGLSTGDNLQYVLKNREIFFNQLKVKQSQLALPRQIHSDNVAIITKPGKYENSDAMVTNTPGVILTIQTADCYPIFLYDYYNKVCAIIHSGWRGTALNITTKTIKIMKKYFKCNPNQILAGIGAGIQQKNYQIDHQTAQKFDINYLISDTPGFYKLNLQRNIYDQLRMSNIPNKNIEIDDRCTYANPDLFYSYRRDGNLSGRMMGIIGIKRTSK